MKAGARRVEGAVLDSLNVAAQAAKGVPDERMA
jgi:hypothetical protein